MNQWIFLVMDKKETNMLLLIFGTIFAVVGLVHLFDNKKRKINFDTEKEPSDSEGIKLGSFETDLSNFQKDFENISGDFHRAKEKLLNGI